MFAKGKHDQYTKIDTYPVTFVSDQIEFDAVRYKLSKVEGWRLDRLLGLLNTEPLEKSGTDSPPILVDSVTTADQGELRR